jgi:hypothetical protein
MSKPSSVTVQLELTKMITVTEKVEKAEMLFKHFPTAAQTDGQFKLINRKKGRKYQYTIDLLAS